MVLRVAFGTDLSVTSDGIAFDDFTIGEAPVSNLGPDTVACDSFVLDAGPGEGYTWNTGDSTRFLSVTSSGTYSLTLIDTNGFPGGDVVQIDIFNTSGAALGADTTVCDGQGLDLEGDGQATAILWSTGDTSQILSVNSSGTYWGEFTYGNACTARDSIEIVLSDLEADFALPSDTLCRGDVLQFMDASTGATGWTWNFGNGNLSTNQDPLTFFPNGGTYVVSLEVTDGTCTAETNQVVFVDVCVGAPEPHLAELGLHPVPAGDHIWLEMTPDSPGKALIQVKDLYGRTLLEREWKLGNDLAKFRIDLEAISTGLLFLEVQKGGSQWTKPFLKVN